VPPPQPLDLRGEPFRLDERPHRVGDRLPAGRDQTIDDVYLVLHSLPLVAPSSLLRTR
jgi:hypothetical protein